MKRSMVLIAVLLVALPVAAQMGSGRMPGMRGTGNDAMMSGIAVGADGTVYVVRHVTGSGNSNELAAINTSGTVVWHTPIDTRAATSIEVASDTIYLSSFGTTGTFPNLSFKSQLLGFSPSTGAKLWSLDLDGVAMSLTPYSGGVYVLEIAAPTSMPAPGMPMLTVGRKLLSVNKSGKAIWSLPLD